MDRGSLTAWFDENSITEWHKTLLNGQSKNPQEPIHLVVDATGIKVYSEDAYDTHDCLDGGL